MTDVWEKIQELRKAAREQGKKEAIEAACKYIEYSEIDRKEYHIEQLKKYLTQINQK